MFEAPVLTITQPIGEFYVGVVPAQVLLPIVSIRQRAPNDPEGVQRQLSARRIKEIALYTSDPDATFPTPIIIACDPDRVTLIDGKIIFGTETKIGEVIDGQHRIEGLQEAQRLAPDSIQPFNMPVVFMLGLEPYEKAYVFSTINSKQTPVPRSLIYDLFSLSETRSPYKTSHEIARTLNSLETSPFFRGLKMLGKRALPTEYLTQGSFVTQLVKRISKAPQKDEISVKKGEVPADNEELPFRYYWIHDRDEVIVKILLNYFGAIRDVFVEEWNPPSADNFVLRKTVGFTALMLAFDQVWTQSRETSNASKEFFLEIAESFKLHLAGRPLTADQFPSSGATAGALRDALLGLAIGH
jgi:DGQHR domain-containing protein